jgi:glutamate synthase (NADPH/NADH)
VIELDLDSLQPQSRNKRTARLLAEIMGRVSFAEDVKDSSIEEIEQEPTSIYEYQNTPENKSWAGALPLKQGLYDPDLEKDACGVGFSAHIKGKASHKIVIDGKCPRTIQHV